MRDRFGAHEKFSDCEMARIQEPWRPAATETPEHYLNKDNGLSPTIRRNESPLLNLDKAETAPVRTYNHIESPTNSKATSNVSNMFS